MPRAKRGGTCHNVKLIAIAADGTVMELSAWSFDILKMDRSTKVGRGECSATACEERAVFLTTRNGRMWAMCQGHAQVYANGKGYWSPGDPYPEVSRGKSRKRAGSAG